MMNVLTADLFERLEDARGTLSVPLITGVVVWLVVFIWQNILVAKGKICNGGLKRIEVAIKEGHVVEAHISSVWVTESGGTDGTNRSERFHRTYIYKIDGKQYKKTLISRRIQYSDVITLYYGRSPARAKTYSQMKGLLPSVWPMLSSVVVATTVIIVLVYLGF